MSRRLGERRRPRDQAAGPLHRGHADQGARGPRDRPPLDVRLDHRHDPQPRLRLQEGHRAGAGLARVLGDPAAGGALPAAWSTTSSPPSMEDVLDEIAGGPQGPRRRARRVLLRRRQRRRPASSWSTTSATSTPASSRRSRSATRAGINLRVGRYGPYVEGPDDEGTPAASAPTCPTTCRPTS